MQGDQDSGGSRSVKVLWPKPGKLRLLGAVGLGAFCYAILLSQGVGWPHRPAYGEISALQDNVTNLVAAGRAGFSGAESQEARRQLVALRNAVNASAKDERNGERYLQAAAIVGWFAFALTSMWLSQSGTPLIVVKTGSEGGDGR